MNMMRTFDVHVEVASPIGHTRATIGKDIIKGLEVAFKDQNTCFCVTDVTERQEAGKEQQV